MLGVSITISARTEELCVQTGVPFLRASELPEKPLTRTTLKQLIAFDPVAYDRCRAERAQAYVGFLEANGVRPAEHLQRIAMAA